MKYCLLVLKMQLEIDNELGNNMEDNFRNIIQNLKKIQDTLKYFHQKPVESITLQTLHIDSPRKIIRKCRPFFLLSGEDIENKIEQLEAQYLTTQGNDLVDIFKEITLPTNDLEDIGMNASVKEDGESSNSKVLGVDISTQLEDSGEEELEQFLDEEFDYNHKPRDMVGGNVKKKQLYRKEKVQDTNSH